MDKNALIVWDRMYEVGIASVDSEHRVLFYAYNTFIKARHRGGVATSVGYAMSFLEDYLKYHFNNEEKLMLQSNYDRYQEHKLEHERLQSEFDNLKSHFACGIEIADQLLNLFRELVLKHVIDDDRDIGSYLRSKERYRTSRDTAIASHRKAAFNGSVDQQPSSSKYDITNQNGRVYKRFEVNIPGIVVNMAQCNNPVMIMNISQRGARISGIKGMFKEATGILLIKDLPIPDLSFIVKDVCGNEFSVLFTVSIDKQAALEKVLRSQQLSDDNYKDAGINDAKFAEEIECIDLDHFEGGALLTD